MQYLFGLSFLGLAFLLTLSGCDRPPATDTSAIGPSAPGTSEPKLLARWDSYSYSPPVYGTETLQMFDDGSCEVASTKGETVPVCRWQNDGKGSLEIRIGPTKEELKSIFGVLQGSMVTNETDRTTGRYLQVTLGEGTTQVFVAGESADARMITFAVEAEQAWETRKFSRALGKFQQAADMGNPYAQMRLGWILATTEEFLDPGEALMLLDPLKQHQNYDVLSALAAAQAANGDFGAAVETATRACELAALYPPKYEQCVNRLSLYREGVPYVIAINPGKG